MEGTGWKLTTYLYQSCHQSCTNPATKPVPILYQSCHQSCHQSCTNPATNPATKPCITYILWLDQTTQYYQNCMRSFRSSREPSIITQYNAQILHLLPPLYNRNFTPANFPSSALLSPPLSSSTVSTITSFHSTFRKQCYCMQHTVVHTFSFMIHAIQATCNTGVL